MSDPDKPVHLLGGTAIKPKERHGWERIRYILHNPETGTILTRTPLSWALITLFYLAYYTFLASFWALIFFVFWQTIDPKTPKWIAEESIIGTSPGLGMRPEQTDALIDSSMIFFNKV
jgi:sodium/potassium-transporting ATPase subunit beta